MLAKSKTAAQQRRFRDSSKRKISRRRLAALVLLGTVSALLQPHVPRAQGYDPTTIAGAMRWRAIGPFRGGRTKAITGVPGNPNVFYMGAVNGGVWKTTDFG